MKRLEVFEKKIGHTFINKDLLIQALSHSSYAYENSEGSLSDNEVMEFLGDSVLGLIIADFLYQAFPQLSEGELSKIKSQAASTTALFDFAKNIKLDKHILLGKGEEKSGGRKKKSILAGAFEALVAAIYLDSGIEETKKFLLPQLNSLLKRINVEKFLINNYKSALQEYLQKRNLSVPVYKTVTSRGPDHKRLFMVEVLADNVTLAKAKGSSKKSAEQKAAQKALKSPWGPKIKTLTPDTFLQKKKHD